MIYKLSIYKLCYMRNLVYAYFIISDSRAYMDRELGRLSSRRSRSLPLSQGACSSWLSWLSTQDGRVARVSMPVAISIVLGVPKIGRCHTVRLGLHGVLNAFSPRRRPTQAVVLGSVWVSETACGGWGTSTSSTITAVSQATTPNSPPVSSGPPLTIVCASQVRGQRHVGGVSRGRSGAFTLEGGVV